MSIIARVLAALCLVGVAASSMAQNSGCSGSRDLKITNGRIHTMDAHDTIVSSVTVRHGLFATPQGASDPCMRVIDVHGRTVVPGLIDNHNHIVLLSERPGHDTRLESAGSIAEVQTALRARSRTVTAADWVTAMGGWIPGQLAEKRLPTQAELDQALPENPALLFVAFTDLRSPTPRDTPFLARTASRSVRPG
ncbi:MAG: amidohydrolase family protein [Steroidobacteraceae bacterium]